MSDGLRVLAAAGGGRTDRIGSRHGAIGPVGPVQRRPRGLTGPGRSPAVAPAGIDGLGFGLSAGVGEVEAGLFGVGVVGPVVGWPGAAVVGWCGVVVVGCWGAAVVRW